MQRLSDLSGDSDSDGTLTWEDFTLEFENRAENRVFLNQIAESEIDKEISLDNFIVPSSLVHTCHVEDQI